MVDFKSRGRELKSWWGQTKINLKKIPPYRILILGCFDCFACLLEVWRVFLLANYFLFKSVWPWCESKGLPSGLGTLREPLAGLGYPGVFITPGT